MSMNAVYRGPVDCPSTIPLFPLSGALLLPRGQMPLNIFEPRYLAMFDDALKSHRLIGIIQPDQDVEEQVRLTPRLYKVGCIGRITQFAETGDGRYLLTLTGVARFEVEEELSMLTAYRQAKVSYARFLADFEARAGEDKVDRVSLLRALKEFALANELKIDWKGVNDAPNEALVNALSMMAPFGAREKQALLEAPDLKARADMLVAITEMELARGGSDTDTTLQ
ncbi:MAG: LON peptidase substrate-binding domain-containing protein [Hyphomicrobiales bacterium]|nr:LON peptidase substrate-binding domain-containing protein [Hyphomicrobiales bacterium]